MDERGVFLSGWGQAATTGARSFAMATRNKRHLADVCIALIDLWEGLKEAYPVPPPGRAWRDLAPLGCSLWLLGPRAASVAVAPSPIPEGVE
ncbi:MAG: hypothetical protein LBK42_05110 [Propionibacteriaceae bacterium]|nr:hypothetical protein [Propionibacteriaceae bacterium]